MNHETRLRRGQAGTAFTPFDEGEDGRIHALAHDLMDDGEFHQAYEILFPYLDGNDDSCECRAVHLQWHLAVVEIAIGKHRDAEERFRRFIMPAVPELDALTDGPSLLWRLLLADESSGHDWRPLAEAARRPENPDDPYVELHEALALAGSGDVVALDDWLDELLLQATDQEDRTLLQLAWGLRCFASKDYGAAERLLADGTERATLLGGSRAQNELFGLIHGEALRRGRGFQAAGRV